MKPMGSLGKFSHDLNTIGTQIHHFKIAPPGLGELVDHTTEKALAPYAVKITGDELLGLKCCPRWLEASGAPHS